MTQGEVASSSPPRFVARDLSARQVTIKDRRAARGAMRPARGVALARRLQKIDGAGARVTRAGRKTDGWPRTVLEQTGAAARHVGAFERPRAQCAHGRVKGPAAVSADHDCPRLAMSAPSSSSNACKMRPSGNSVPSILRWQERAKLATPFERIARSFSLPTSPATTL